MTSPFLDMTTCLIGVIDSSIGESQLTEIGSDFSKVFLACLTPLADASFFLKARLSFVTAAS